MPNPDELERIERMLRAGMTPEEKAAEEARANQLKETLLDAVMPKLDALKSAKKPILCLDFDGVCHSYISGWKGADVIPDPPVFGLFEFLFKAQQVFEIHIFSTRSLQDGGAEAMAQWFDEWLWKWYEEHCKGPELGPALEPLHFPLEKPPALVTLDDRAITFTGVFPDIATLKTFKPWNKK
jgi:hypothetical protein